MKKNTILDFISKFGLALIILIILTSLGIFRSFSINFKESFVTKTSILSIAKNDSVAKGFEVNKNIAARIISKLDLIKFSDNQKDIIEISDSKWHTEKMSNKFFRIINEDKAVVVLEKLNNTRLYAMNTMFYNSNVDIVNQVYEDQ